MSAPSPVVRRAGELVGELINTVDDSEDLLAVIAADGTAYNVVGVVRELHQGAPATVWLRIEER